MRRPQPSTTQRSWVRASSEPCGPSAQLPAFLCLPELCIYRPSLAKQRNRASPMALWLLNMGLDMTALHWRSGASLERSLSLHGNPDLHSGRNRHVSFCMKQQAGQCWSRTDSQIPQARALYLAHSACKRATPLDILSNRLFPLLPSSALASHSASSDGRMWGAVFQSSHPHHPQPEHLSLSLLIPSLQRNASYRWTS